MSREKQIEEIAQDICGYCNKSRGTCVLDGEKCDLKCTSRDTAETVYNANYRKQIEGKWIIDRSPIEAEFKCSECGYSYIEADPQAETEYKFCPECGAKMKGENK